MGIHLSPIDKTTSLIDILIVNARIEIIDIEGRQFLVEPVGQQRNYLPRFVRLTGFRCMGSKQAPESFILPLAEIENSVHVIEHLAA